MSCIDSIGFAGNVWLATSYTTADSVVYVGRLSAVVE